MAQALEPDARGDWLRMLGGVLVAVGAIILFARKSSDWAMFPLFLVVAIPCALLFTLGAMAALAAGAVARWHAVLMVTAVLLSPFAFAQLFEILGIDSDSAGFAFLIFAGVTALAGVGAFVVGAAYQAFLAAVAGLGAWVFFFDMLFLDDPGGTAYRWLLLVICAIYAAFAIFLRSRDAPQAPEIVTAAGIAAVLVGVIGPLSEGGGLGIFFFGGQAGGPGGGQSIVWDIFLLLVSLGLVAYGAGVQARGPAYVGFFGLVAFAGFQAAELNTLLDGEEPERSIAGWPLILLLVGGGALAAGMFARPAPPGPPEQDTYEVRS